MEDIESPHELTQLHGDVNVEVESERLEPLSSTTVNFDVDVAQTGMNETAALHSARHQCS